MLRWYALKQLPDSPHIIAPTLLPQTPWQMIQTWLATYPSFICLKQKICWFSFLFCFLREIWIINGIKKKKKERETERQRFERCQERERGGFAEEVWGGKDCVQLRSKIDDHMALADCCQKISISSKL